MQFLVFGAEPLENNLQNMQVALQMRGLHSREWDCELFHKNEVYGFKDLGDVMLVKLFLHSQTDMEKEPFYASIDRSVLGCGPETSPTTTFVGLRPWSEVPISWGLPWKNSCCIRYRDDQEWLDMMVRCCKKTSSSSSGKIHHVYMYHINCSIASFFSKGTQQVQCFRTMPRWFVADPCHARPCHIFSEQLRAPGIETPEPWDLAARMDWDGFEGRTHRETLGVDTPKNEHGT